MTKVWFITGSSRGLGHSLTAAVLAKGDRVVATARQPEHLKAFSDQYGDQILALGLDVNDKAQIQATVKAAIAQFGRIDVLVNNAGFGIMGAAEAFTDAQVRSQLETNLYAPIEITRAILPHMRRQRSGRILQVSSIGGRVGGASLTMYQAAKFGLSGFSEALAPEVAPLGIFVTSVEPGGFRTEWGGASMSFAPQVEGYEQTVDQRAQFMSSGQFSPMGDPDKAAQAMITIVEDNDPPVHLVLGSEAISLLQHANSARQAAMEKWLSLSRSTDAEGAINLFETEVGKGMLKMKG